MKISEYQKQDWQVEDGLPQSNIRMITQTQDGMLLIATSGGMVSFDGLHFKPVKVDVHDTIANEAVNALMVTRNGDLWIGTDGRGIVIQRKSGGTESLSEKEGFPTDRIRMFYEAEDGAVWVATQNGIERIHSEKIELLKDCGMISGDITTPFAEDGRGGVFFVTSRGLFLWRNGVALPFVLHQPASSGMAVAVYRDPQHRIWVGMMHGVVQLVPRGEGWQELPNTKVSGPVTLLVGDRDGNLWVGTRHRGICRIEPDGQVSFWTSADGLPNDAIRSMYIDDEQNLWIGMMNGGMERWRKAPLIPYGRPEGLPAEYAANVLGARDGDLWMGTWGKGVFRLHSGRLETVHLNGTPATVPIRALAQDRRGNIWIGTWFNGIYSYDGNEFHHYLLGTESPGNAVSTIVGDNQGALWVGTYTGLLRFPGGTPGPDRQMLLPGQLVTCLSQDRDGTMLVGTSNGLYRIDGQRAQAVSGLSHPYVLSIAEDRAGNTWAGTKAGGVDLIEGVNARHIPTQNGPSEYPVFSVLDDGRGFIWMGTTRGLLRVSAQQLNGLAHGARITLDSLLLGKSDGTRSSECGGPSQPAATLAKDGSLWFATARGFVHTAATAAQIEYPPPAVRIEDTTLDGVDMDPAGILDLPPGLNELTIHFTAKRLANPGQLEFRYRLDGYDKDWSVTRGRTAHYKRLPPGHYQFVVQARDEGMAWNNQTAELAVRQRPFFYQTLWFYAILLLAFCLLALQFLRWRMTRMKGALGLVLEERNRIAREWHDTLMAGFAAISWQLETTVRLFRESNAGGSSPATQSCELARSMVSHCQAEARRIIWDLRDGDEPADTLSLALERTLSTMRTTRQVETRLEVIGNEVPLAPGSVHQLVCIGQEAVINALRHAEPNRISIRLHYQNGALSLSVKDDGRGFQPSAASEVMKGHFGIPVMEERARKLGGTLRVETATGRGTEIVVNVPFQVSALATGVRA